MPQINLKPLLETTRGQFNKQLLDEVEHDIMRKPNSIIVLLYIF